MNVYIPGTGSVQISVVWSVNAIESSYGDDVDVANGVKVPVVQ